MIKRIISVSLLKNKVEFRKIDGLKIGFNVEQSFDSEPNSCELQIWNLSDDTISLFKDPSTEISIKAGYEGQTTELVFWGNAVEIDTYFQGPDKITTFRGKDGGEQLAKTRVKFSSLGQTDLKTLVTKIVSSMKGIAFNSDQSNKLLPAAIAASEAKSSNKKKTRRRSRLNNLSRSVTQGTAREILDDILRPLEINYFINFGVFNIFLPKETPTELVSINKDSGILKQPERTEKTIRLSLILNPKLYPGVFFSLQSLKVSGIYRVVYANHYGDNYSSPWITEVEAVPL